MTPSVIQELGNRYGKLTVLEFLKTRPDRKFALWVCQCDCGRQRVVRGTRLRKGEITSCGCCDTVEQRSTPTGENQRKSLLS